MKFRLRLFALLASLFAFVSVAGARPIGGPTQGLWYNPQESGRGYGIDLQGDTMVVTTYIYQESGDPIWYLSSGPYDHASGVFQSTYDSYSGGQCFGCPYVAPTVHAGAAGPITIAFATNQTATLTYSDGSASTPIIKYGYGFPSRTAVLYGEWALSYENAGAVIGDWIVFDTPYTNPDGTVFVSGRAVGAPSTTALGTFDDASSEAQITVTEGTTVRYYRFGIFDDHRGIGVATSTVGTVVAGPYPATGARLLYESELAYVVIGSTSSGAALSAPETQATSAAVAIPEKLQRAAQALSAAKK